jgi:GT2 family glycosyltransferase
MMESLRLSVIIPTKGRPSELVIVTHNLLNQTLLPAEIIIIDQSLDDGGRCLVSQLLAAAPSEVRDSVRLEYVLDQSISGGSAARNHGLKLATGNVWLCLDDDVELEKEFLEEIISAFRFRPGAAAVCGIITNYLPPPWSLRLWSRVFALGPFFDERQPIYWNADRLRDSEPIRIHKLNGGAMAFRAEPVRGLHFDANLTGVSLAEDIDFAVRIEPSLMVMAPRARLIHKRSPHGRATHHWLREQAQASYYLYQRNWRHGLPNHLRFLWLNVGYAFAITLSCLKRGTCEPLAAFREGARRGRELGQFVGGHAVAMSDRVESRSAKQVSVQAAPARTEDFLLRQVAKMREDKQ